MSIWACVDHGVGGPEACCRNAARVFPDAAGKAQISTASFCLSCKEKDIAISELVDGLREACTILEYENVYDTDDLRALIAKYKSTEGMMK